MKWLNIVLSVLVLLLAIASAVCSYFLFEKRELLVKGWSKMAVSVSNAAKELDKGSGTEVAKSVSPEEIGHGNYDNLDSNLTKFNDQAREISKQREVLGKAISNTAEIMEMPNHPGQNDLTKLDSYENAVSNVTGHVKTIKNRYDDTIKQISATGNKIKTPLNANALKGAQYKTEYAKLDNQISAMDSRIQSYDGAYRRFAGIVGVSLANPDFEYSAINATTNKIQGGIQKIKTDLKTAENTIAQKDRDIAGIKKTVSDKDQQLANEKIAFGKLKERNETLNQLLEKEGIPSDTTLWTDGSKEAKRALQGKIIEIDNHFGFMVIDIGSATKVGQKVGPKIAYFNPKIADDAEFLVVRDFDNKNSKYIGRIKLFKLSENNAYAKWVAPPIAGEKVKVGDFVFLPDDTMEAAPATKK